MIASLGEVLAHQVRAVESLQARLRALELIVAAREQRYLTEALAEVDAAADQLASLELTRSLVMVAAGLAADVGADEVLASLEATDREADDLRALVERLRGATHALEDDRARTAQAVREAAAAVGQRRQAAAALAAV